MKKNIKIFGSLFLIAAAIVACSELIRQQSPDMDESIRTRAVGFVATDYYWYEGEKIPLQKIDDKFYVAYYSANEERLKAEFAKAGIELPDSKEIAKFNSYSCDMTGTGVSKFINYKTAIVEGSYEKNKAILSSAFYVAPYFRTEYGDEVGITEMFSVKLKPDTKMEQVEELAKKYLVEMLGADKHLPEWYMLNCTHLSKGNSLEMANAFYDSDLFEETTPDHIIKIKQYSCVIELTSSTLDLWHLSNTSNPIYDIDYCNARTLIPIASSNITVAIIDMDGVQTNHPDLYNVLPGWDAKNKTAPNNVTGGHGTEMAGFIGAIPNNINRSVAGIAYGVKILPISINPSYSNYDDLKAAFNYAADNGADVITFSTGLVGSPNTAFTNAIVNILNNGRGGKGCILVFAAGNENASSIPYPANIDQKILVVGAMNKSGQRVLESNTGSMIDIVAPGYNLCSTAYGGGYATGIGGTSYAAPQAAAVAALILSTNPNLTRQRVTEIIEQSAYKLPGFTYNTYSDRPNGSYNLEVGYGLLNAFTAIHRAPEINGPDVIGSCSATYTVPSLPSGVTGTWSVTGGGVTTSPLTGTSLTVTRTNNLNDPANITIKFSLTYRNQTYTLQKNVTSRILPVIWGATGAPYGDPNGFEAYVNQPTYFVSQIHGLLRPYIKEYQWEIITNTGVGYVLLSGEHTTTPVYFPAPGSYRVSLRVRDDCGWSKWDEKFVQVYW